MVELTIILEVLIGVLGAAVIVNTIALVIVSTKYVQLKNEKLNNVVHPVSTTSSEEVSTIEESVSNSSQQDENSMLFRNRKKKNGISSPVANKMELELQEDVFSDEPKENQTIVWKQLSPRVVERISVDQYCQTIVNQKESGIQTLKQTGQDSSSQTLTEDREDVEIQTNLLEIVDFVTEPKLVMDAITQYTVDSHDVVTQTVDQLSTISTMTTQTKTVEMKTDFTQTPTVEKVDSLVGADVIIEYSNVTVQATPDNSSVGVSAIPLSRDVSLQTTTDSTVTSNSSQTEEYKSEPVTTSIEHSSNTVQYNILELIDFRNNLMLSRALLQQDLSKYNLLELLTVIRDILLLPLSQFSKQILLSLQLLNKIFSIDESTIEQFKQLSDSVNSLFTLLLYYISEHEESEFVPIVVQALVTCMKSDINVSEISVENVENIIEYLLSREVDKTCLELIVLLVKKYETIDVDKSKEFLKSLLRMTEDGIDNDLKDTILELYFDLLIIAYRNYIDVYTEFKYIQLIPECSSWCRDSPPLDSNTLIVLCDIFQTINSIDDVDNTHEMFSVLSKLMLNCSADYSIDNVAPDESIFDILLDYCTECSDIETISYLLPVVGDYFICRKESHKIFNVIERVYEIIQRYPENIEILINCISILVNEISTVYQNIADEIFNILCDKMFDINEQQFVNSIGDWRAYAIVFFHLLSIIAGEDSSVLSDDLMNCTQSMLSRCNEALFTMKKQSFNEGFFSIVQYIGTILSHCKSNTYILDELISSVEGILQNNLNVTPEFIETFVNTIQENSEVQDLGQVSVLLYNYVRDNSKLSHLRSDIFNIVKNAVLLNKENTLSSSDVLLILTNAIESELDVDRDEIVNIQLEIIDKIDNTELKTICDNNSLQQLIQYTTEYFSKNSKHDQYWKGMKVITRLSGLVENHSNDKILSLLDISESNDKLYDVLRYIWTQISSSNTISIQMESYIIMANNLLFEVSGDINLNREYSLSLRILEQINEIKEPSKAFINSLFQILLETVKQISEDTLLNTKELVVQVINTQYQLCNSLLVLKLVNYLMDRNVISDWNAICTLLMNILNCETDTNNEFLLKLNTILVRIFKNQYLGISLFVEHSITTLYFWKSLQLMAKTYNEKENIAELVYESLRSDYNNDKIAEAVLNHYMMQDNSGMSYPAFNILLASLECKAFIVILSILTRNLAKNITNLNNTKRTTDSFMQFTRTLNSIATSKSLLNYYHANSLETVEYMNDIIGSLSQIIQRVKLPPFGLSSSLLYYLTSEDNIYVETMTDSIYHCLTVCEQPDIVRVILSMSQYSKKCIHRYSNNRDSTTGNILCWIYSIDKKGITKIFSEHNNVERCLLKHLKPLVEKVVSPVILPLINTMYSWEIDCDKIQLVDRAVKITQEYHANAESNSIYEILDVCDKKWRIRSKKLIERASILSEQFKPTIKPVTSNVNSIALLVWNNLRDIFNDIKQYLLSNSINNIVEYLGLTSRNKSNISRTHLLVHVLRYLPDDIFYQFTYITVDEIKKIIHICNQLLENEIAESSNNKYQVTLTSNSILSITIDIISIISNRNSISTFIPTHTFCNEFIENYFNSDQTRIFEYLIPEAKELSISSKSIKNNTIFHILYKRVPVIFSIDIKTQIFSILIDHTNSQSNKDVFSIKRNDILTSSYQAFMSRKKSDLINKTWKVQFQGEEALDIKGVRREFVTLLSQELINKLFSRSPENNTYYPSRENTQLQLFEMCGRFIGKCLRENELVDAHFCKFVYKRLLGKKLVRSVFLIRHIFLTWCLELSRFTVS
jgi:hypothetical protein